MAAEVNIVINAQDNFSSTLGNFGSIITGIESAINLVGQAFDAAVGVITPFINSASDSEQAIARLEGVLRATGGAVGLTSQQLQDMATNLQSVTRYSDEEIMSAEAILLTFRNIGEDVFPRAINAVADMSEIFGGLDASAMQLGKALQDPVGMMGALSRAGITFSDTQKEMIQNFVETGNVAAAQDIILSEVEKQVGGLAETMGTTFAGQATIFRNKLDEIRETIGGALLPVLSGLLSKLSEFLDQPEVIQFFNDLGTSLSNFLTSLHLEDQLSGFLDTISTAVQTGDWTPVWEKIKTAIQGGWDYIRPTIDDLFARVFAWMEQQVRGWIDGGGPDRLSNTLVASLNETFGSPEFQSNARVALGTLVNTLSEGISRMDWSPIRTALGQSFMRMLEGIGDTFWSWFATEVFNDSSVENFWQGAQIGGDRLLAILFPFTAGDQFREIGANIINGLWEGMQSVLNALGLNGVAQWWEDHIITPVKRLLGIASPSTVFLNIGKDIITGFINGIESLETWATTKIKEILATILAPFKPILDALGIDTSNLFATGGTSGSHDTGGLTTTNGGSIGGGTSIGGFGGDTGGTSTGAGGGNVFNFYGPIYVNSMEDIVYDCLNPNPTLTSLGTVPGGL